MRLHCERIPEKNGNENQWRDHAPEQSRNARESKHYGKHGDDAEIIQDQLDHVSLFYPATFA